ncbi:hypothetical protein [Streptomyces yaizuensis]|uniref:NERD domain-containing protein n=1 Tax=Streptomyces yaizuensis TaxID=2989713 RepID=A0ABQ5P6N0_9ACTN|nr:hypothetical protein [Streptomyces sp. YSPA8]GLF98245.1 NERD domain-containing protein [Streptomyces sp. YSPA8]
MPQSVPAAAVPDKQYVRRILRHSQSSLVELIAATGARLPHPRDLRGHEGLGVYGPWALADAAWISLALGQEINRAPAQPRDLAQILGFYLALDDPFYQESPGEEVTRLLLRVFGQQLIWHVDEHSELSRTVALLTQSSTPEPLKVIGPGWAQDVLGCSVADYVGLALYVWATATGHPFLEFKGRFIPDMMLAPVGYSAFSTLRSAAEATAVLERHFVTDVPRLRAAYPASPDPLLRRYGHNPLRTAPLVAGFGDGYLVPVPAAVLSKASMLGLYYTGGEENSTPRGKAFTSDLGKLFEAYAGRQLGLLDHAMVHPEIHWLGEKKGQSGKSVDWIVVFPDLVLLVEVKSARPSAGLRLGAHNYAEMLAKRPGEGFAQIERTDLLISEGNPAFAQIPPHLPRRGMVITMEPFHLLNTAELRAGILRTPNPVTGETIPITTASIHELEHAVTLTDISLSQLLLTHPPNGSLRQLLAGHEFLERNPILEKGGKAIPFPGPPEP